MAPQLKYDDDLHYGLYPFLRIGFKTDALCSF
jgi:hypothetical protein